MKKIITLLSSFMLIFMMSNVFANMQDAGKTLDDAAVTTAVKSSLLKNQLVNGEDYNTWTVHVETTQGVVHLTGHVKTEADKSRAADVTQKVDGVTSVKNDLLVQP
jgi:hyperosmotically inducible protein